MGGRRREGRPLLSSAAGVVATCNAGGAGKWRDEYAEALHGAKVVVVADRDDPGRKHARQVADSLRKAGCTVRVVEPKVGKDASDHLGGGLGLEEFTSGGTPASSTGSDAGWQVLDDVAGFLRRFVAFPSDEAANAVTLWVLHAHTIPRC